MKFAAEIEKVESLKKHFKVVIYADKEANRRFLSQIDGFIDKPVKVEVLVDEDRQKEILDMISEEQRRKTYAILRDISNHIGDVIESTKLEMKHQFAAAGGPESFSLSDCSREVAREFITFLIKFCFEYGVPMSEHPKSAFDDPETYARICLETNTCCICGKRGEVHHCTGSRIGMGRNRNKVDDTGKLKICLCREHHSEMHNGAEEDFFMKYHVVPAVV